MLSDLGTACLQILVERIHAAVSFLITFADGVSNAISARGSRHFPSVVSESLHDLACSFVVVVKHGFREADALLLCRDRLQLIIH